MPVNAVLVGRRNNPAEAAAGIRGLAVYNPIHYQELPELFMDFICSLTGKSPSTTGAGSEGALTKSPFNAAAPDHRSEQRAGQLHPHRAGRFFDVGRSCRAQRAGRSRHQSAGAGNLVPAHAAGARPAVHDSRGIPGTGRRFRSIDGETILASRLGYRITERFVRTFFGRVFDNPSKVFDEAILKPETQDPDDFVDGIKNITEAQQRVAAAYLEDGSIADACPPLRALLTIMATRIVRRKRRASPGDPGDVHARIPAQASDWYRQRLLTKQERDVALWRRHLEYLDEFLKRPTHRSEAVRLHIPERREQAVAELARVSGTAYLSELSGTLGADPLEK